MPDSNITVTALSITPGIGHNLGKWTFTDPNAIGLDSLKHDATELWAATSNDRTLASKVGEGRDNAAHMGLTEGVTYYYWVKARNKSGFYGDWYPSGSTSGVIGTVGFAAGAAQALINGKITAAVGSNALTVAVKTLSGDDPSALNPVFVGFRLTDGTYVVRSLTAAISVVVSAGSHLGNASANKCRKLWLAAFDNSGTVALAVINCGGDGVSPLNESGVASTTAEGGAGAADSSSVFYSTAAITSKPFRVVGFLEWSTPIATAGNWAAVPNTIHLAGVGTKFPGDIVQMVIAGSSVYTSGSADIPFDDTGPTASEGVLVADATFTPASPCNTVVLEFVTFGARSTAGTVIAYIIEASALEALIGVAAAGANEMAMVAARTSSYLNSVTVRTYSLRRGAGGAGATFYGGGDSGGRKFGGGMYSFMSITELAG